MANSKSSYDDIISQAIGSGGGVGGSPDADAAQAWAKTIMSNGLGDPRYPIVPTDPNTVLTAPSIQGPDAIAYLQNRLINAGLLDPRKVSTIGAFDLSTIDAMSSVEKVKGFYGFTNEWDAIDALSKGLVNGGGGSARQPFTAPAFQPIPDNVLHDAVLQGLQNAEGKAPAELLNSVIASFRSAEKTHYGQEVGAAQNNYSGAASEGTVQQLPNPQDFAQSQVSQGDDATVWRAAQNGMALVQALKGGL